MPTARILPGATIGILGGGPMGRLTALAARALGYRVHVLDADPSGATDGVADRVVRGAPTDLAAVAELARGCHVVTTAVEQVPPFSLEAAARHALVRPGAAVVAIAQDRAIERAWLEARGLQLGPWRAAASRDELARAIDELGGACYVKPRVRRSGDGGPTVVVSATEAGAVWLALRGRPCVVEARLPIDLELSVLVARGPGGAMQTYPAALSRREHAALLWSVLPGPVPPQLAAKAEALAAYVAARLGLEGLLAVELFLLRDGRLVVNELVPGPHPTFHAAELACATGQCEQLVRAITGLPLGLTTAARPGASAPIGGEHWDGGQTPALDEALRVPGVRLHLYGAPRGARPDGAAGHVSAVGETSEDAVRTVLRAVAHLPADRARRSLVRRRARRSGVA